MAKDRDLELSPGMTVSRSTKRFGILFYIDVAVRRWEAFTGQAANLEGNGRGRPRRHHMRSESGTANPMNLIVWPGSD
jgi:hypothetical protein